MENTTNSFEVIVLFEGYSKSEDGFTKANCSCTLIKGTPNIIVDTMTAWDGVALRNALKNHNVECEDIGYVICTHGHSDHMGCNYLFPNATHVVGFCISHQNKYFDHDFKSEKPYFINDQIKVVATPGHTLQDVSVIVDLGDHGVVAITGDLFEREEDLLDGSIWRMAGSDSEKLQILNRKRILDVADFIVPGHGPKFKVNKSINDTSR